MNQLSRLNVVVLTTTKNMAIPDGIFEKKGLYNLHFNMNTLLPRIDEIRFIVKQSNASIIGISEF